ncbi:RND family efflux transporter MFP subunit [Vulcaniibacterium tengchongense]|uniref:RND family efflux transporter MFP subunit n=2 Tax=Vulcaniibacterium tengchongense TaxID=1273429 RepID=A0A3N4VIG5_9GAMM|nr:efflux RND transporter periplasmic adaptor subunit [Vulcaniibacterium tengchongense]RPE79479.1 RND family efflux transporter MFP subunit [Vulcaniibacterium tengchongense]
MTPLVRSFLSARGASPLLLAAALAAAAGCGRGHAEQAAAAPLPEVRTAQARPAGDSYELRLPARTAPGESAQIYPRATGFVGERHADLGDRVEAGQVLAVISAPEVDQEVRQAQAELERARAELALARAHYQRAEVLVRSGAISQELYSERSANRQAAEAAVAAAEARLASARERQAFQRVRAPFAGVIAARYVERGDRVVGDSASSQPLFALNALDPLRIVVDVPQRVALQVRPGVQADVSFPELPGRRFRAEVVRTAQSISEDVGGMRVELRLPNPEQAIPAGMVGEVALRLPQAATTLLLPVSAVLQDAGGARVARLGADATIGFRKVVLGRNLGDQVEVLDGLAAGDTVVLAPNALLREGSRVRVAPPADAGARKAGARS